MSLLLMAAAATAFNLGCVGDEVETINDQQRDSSFEVTLRIDLSANRWCDGDCITTSPILRLSATTIILEEGKSIIGLDVETHLQREVGRYVRVVAGHNYSLIDVGLCQRRPFTGFPAQKF